MWLRDQELYEIKTEMEPIEWDDIWEYSPWECNWCCTWDCLGGCDEYEMFGEHVNQNLVAALVR